jgi:hypothetical protein
VDPVTRQRRSPRFPVPIWNVFDRVRLGLPRTNNAAESWHNRIQRSLKKHMSFIRVVEFFKSQQANSENEWILLSKGESVSKLNKEQVKRDDILFNLVDNYNKNRWKDHLNSVEKNMGTERKIV